MTAKINSALKQIILLLLVAGMILGLLYSAVSDESYDAVRGLGEYRNEISAPVLHGVSDIIADNSAGTDQTRFLTERSKPVRHFLASPDNTGRSDFKNFSILTVNIFLFLFCVLFSTPFKHIFYIHLKDGNK